MIIVGIKKGRIELRGSERDKSTETYGPEDRSQLVERLIALGAEMLGSGFMGSSDMDFAEECGWPDSKADAFFQSALDEACRRVRGDDVLV